MPTLAFDAVREYLASLYGKPVQLLSLSHAGTQEQGDDLKGFGYGVPLFLEYTVDNEKKKAVLETMSPSAYGHEHFSDRAQSILWEHAAFNNLPRHVRSLDSGAMMRSGKLISTGNAAEFFLLTEFCEGSGYFKDLERIRDTGARNETDMLRCCALADYLADIHKQKKTDQHLYRRRIRELMGHGECIMGLIDNYPAEFGFINSTLLQGIEQACIEWRWRIKSKTHRLAQVHGDFHPWNVLFRNGADFTVLDRSRGEWGEPADDLAAMSINYIFFSLQQSGKFEGRFEELFRAFWNNYLAATNDYEILEVIAPFFAWRGLVIASPEWYPHLSEPVRSTIFRFIRNVLAAPRFDPADVRRFLQ
jgi:hypothetical protein